MPGRSWISNLVPSFLRPKPQPFDPDMMKILEAFRRDRAESLDAHLAVSRAHQAGLRDLQEQLAEFRTYRQTVERRLMARGLDELIPDDPSSSDA
jgi:hypothetical protein